MTIKDNFQPERTFGSLEVGDVFRDRDDAVCMKIGQVMGEGSAHYNCVDLADGSLYLYNSGERVTHIPNPVLTLG